MGTIAGEEILELFETLNPTAPTGGNLFLYNKMNEALMIGYPDGSEFPIHTPNDKTLVVSKNGNARFNTVKAAVEFATANGNNFEIDVQPGIYIEDNPINLGSNNTIHSDSGPFITTIVAMNSDQNLLNIGGNCFVRALRLVGCTGASAISHNQFLGNSAVTESIISACGNGVEVYGFPGTMMLFDTQVACDATNKASRGLYAHSGGEIYGSTVVLSGYPTNLMDEGIRCEGFFTSGPYYRTSLVYIAVATTNYSLVGLCVNNNGRIKFNASSSRQNVKAIHIGPTGVSEVLLRGVDMFGNTTDLHIEAEKVKFVGNGVEIDPMKIVNVHNADINIVAYSNADEEEGMYIFGKFNVGEPAHPSRTQLGSGDNYTRSMKVFWNDNGETGTWTDQTSAATFNTTPDFTLFAGTGAGCCTYWGSDFPFGGIGTRFADTTDEADIINRVWETWNGTSWEQFNIMTTSNDVPYYSYCHKFGVATGITSNRFGIKTSDMLSYGKKTLNGVEKYWVRLRATNNQVSNPTVQKCKIHSSHKRIEQDGYVEYYGDARPISKFPWEMSDIHPANTTPTNYDIFLSDNLVMNRSGNRFPNGSTTRVGFNSLMPYELDTSFPIKIQWDSVGNSDNAGDVYWVIRWGKSTIGSNIYNNDTDAPSTVLGEKSSTHTHSIGAGKKDTHLICIEYISVNDMNFRNSTSNDIFWVTIERQGGHASDTYDGDIGIIQLSAFYIKWCEGGHITMF